MRNLLESARYYARIYRLLQAQYLKSRLHYRADFVISSIGMALSSLLTLWVFWILLRSIDELDGWSINEILFMYGFFMLAISPMQILFDKIWDLRTDVQTGDFIKYYFRPMNMLFYYLAERVDIKGLTQLVLGIGLVGWSSRLVGIAWTPVNFGLLLVALLGASLVQISIVVTASSLSFWVVNSWPPVSLAWRMREFAPYPTSMFSGALRFLFTYVVPIGFIAFYPSSAFLENGGQRWLALLTLPVGVFAFTLTYRVWSAGVRSWSGTGS